MSWLSNILIMLVATALQVAAWPWHRAIPALVLTAAVLAGFHDTGRGWRLALVGGVILDLYAQRHFGLFLTAVLLGYGATLLLRPAAEEASLALRFSGIVLAAVVYHLAIVSWLAITSHLPFLDTLVKVATLDIVATLVAFGLLQGLLFFRPPKPTHGTRPISTP